MATEFHTRTRGLLTTHMTRGSVSGLSRLSKSQWNSETPCVWGTDNGEEPQKLGGSDTGESAQRAETVHRSWSA